MALSGMKKYLKFLENGATIEINIPLCCIDEYNSFYWQEFISNCWYLFLENDCPEFKKIRADSFVPSILCETKERSISCRKQTFFTNNSKCCHHKITILPHSQNDNNHKDILKSFKKPNINSVDFGTLTESEDYKTSYNNSVAVEEFVKIQEPKREHSNFKTKSDKLLITLKFGENFIQRSHQYFRDTMVVAYRSLPTNAVTLYEQDLHLNFNSLKFSLPDENILFSSRLDLSNSYVHGISPSYDECYYSSQFPKQPELYGRQELILDLAKKKDYKGSILGLTANSSSNHNHFEPNPHRMSSPKPQTSDALLNNSKQIFDESELKSLSEIKEDTNLDFSISQDGYERVNDTLLTTIFSLPSKQTSLGEVPTIKEKFTKILPRSSHMVMCPVPYCNDFIEKTKKHMSMFHSDLPKWKQKFYCDMMTYNKTEKNYVCHVCPLCHSIQFHMKWHFTQVHNVVVHSKIFKCIRQTSETIILTPERFFMEALINAFECQQLKNHGIQCKTLMEHSRHVREFFLTLMKYEIFSKLFLGKVVGSNLSALINILCDSGAFNKQQIVSEQLHSLKLFFEFLHCNREMFLPDGTNWLHMIFPSWDILKLTEMEIFLVACRT